MSGGIAWSYGGLRKVTGDLLADTGEPVPDLLGPQQRGFDVGDDVTPADVLDELRLLEEGRRLLPRAADDQGAARRAQPIVQDLNRVQAGRVDRRHVADAKDDDGRERR